MKITGAFSKMREQIAPLRGELDVPPNARSQLRLPLLPPSTAFTLSSTAGVCKRR